MILSLSSPCAELLKQTDSMKTLQRGKLLATVVRERHSQLAQQGQQRAGAQAAEAAFLKQQQQQIQVCPLVHAMPSTHHAWFVLCKIWQTRVPMWSWLLDLQQWLFPACSKVLLHVNTICQGAMHNAKDSSCMREIFFCKRFHPELMSHCMVHNRKPQQRSASGLRLQRSTCTS